MLSDAQRIRLLELMIRARVFEESLGAEFARQRELAKKSFGGRNSVFETYNSQFRIPIQGNLELAIGQEPGPAAACLSLQPQDYAAGTHRSHALALCKGVPMRDILAEIYGRANGLCGGRGGDFTLNDPRVNFENSAIMGQLTAVALGFGFAHLRRGTGGIATVFVGDGACNQGVVHEAMNLAALWRLPVIFVIEDNGYAISTPRARGSSVADLSLRAGAYGMPGERIDDATPAGVEAIAVRFRRMAETARGGGGPSLLVVGTRRLRGAFEGDTQAYRPDGELDAEWRRDGFAAYREHLVAAGVVTRERVDGLAADAAAEFRAALRHAEEGPYPDPASVYDHVFA